MKLVSSHFIILFSKASNNSVNKVENPLSMIIWDAALLALLKRRKNIINIIISKWFLSYGWKSSANKWKLFLLSYNLFFSFSRHSARRRINIFVSWFSSWTHTFTHSFLIPHPNRRLFILLFISVLFFMQRDFP